jgi:multiple antibiotic resistance protein
VREFFNTFLLVYAALFPIVNPVGSAPLFLSMTSDDDEAWRNRAAGQIAVYSFFLLLGSMFLGSHVLAFFGISIPAVQVGGGIVVTAFGWKLLNAGSSSEGTHVAHHLGDDDADAFYPLTMPLTVGPGSISVAITLGAQRHPTSEIEPLVLVSTAAVVSLVAMAITIYLCYRFAHRLVSALGHIGTSIVMRLSAFILLCIGVQILWNGLRGLTHAV